MIGAGKKALSCAEMLPEVHLYSERIARSPYIPTSFSKNPSHMWLWVDSDQIQNQLLSATMGRLVNVV